MGKVRIFSAIVSLALLFTIGTVNTYASSDIDTTEDVEVFINNGSRNKASQEENDVTGTLYDNQINNQFITIDGLSESTLLELQDGYTKIMDYAIIIEVPLNMDYVDFIKGFNEGTYESVEVYVDVFYSLLNPMQNNNQSMLKSSGSSKYYYNIGTSLPNTAIPNYSEYDLLSTVQKGDVIYEANGGFGITGHIAVVEGFFYNVTQNVTYIRIIEAIDVGVCRSLLDDTRVNDKDAYVLRVDNAALTNKNQAVTFCIGELGSVYSLDFAKDTSSSETDWYCSELVWAAYKNQGIDIEREPLFSEPGITPHDIYNCDGVISISFK